MNFKKLALFSFILIPGLLFGYHKNKTLSYPKDGKFQFSVFDNIDYFTPSPFSFGGRIRDLYGFNLFSPFELDEVAIKVKIKNIIQREFNPILGNVNRQELFSQLNWETDLEISWYQKLRKQGYVVTPLTALSGCFLSVIFYLEKEEHAMRNKKIHQLNNKLAAFGIRILKKITRTEKYTEWSARAEGREVEILKHRDDTRLCARLTVDQMRYGTVTNRQVAGVFALSGLCSSVCIGRMLYIQRKLRVYSWVKQELAAQLEPE